MVDTSIRRPFVKYYKPKHFGGERIITSAEAISRNEVKEYLKAISKRFAENQKDEYIKITQNHFETNIHPALHELAEEIEHSKHLMSLEENIEEDFLPITEATWVRAICFMTRYAEWIYENSELKTVVATPQINPGPNRSIDILWRNEAFRLLINIPSDMNMPIQFYGDNNKGGNNVGGTLLEDSIQIFFAIWIDSLSK